MQERQTALNFCWINIFLILLSKISDVIQIKKSKNKQNGNFPHITTTQYKPSDKGGKWERNDKIRFQNGWHF